MSIADDCLSAFVRNCMPESSLCVFLYTFAHTEAQKYTDRETDGSNDCKMILRAKITHQS